MASPDPGEEVLTGGHLTTVVRVGDTVRRQAGPWAPTVHALLDHLASKGFNHSPRTLGFDERGREVLSFVPGDTVGGDLPWPDWVWSEEILVEVGRATAQFHRAVADFRPSGTRPWSWGPAELAEGQIICHNDIAPYNVVAESGHLRAFIDWDLSGPGTTRSDLAFVAWQWVPLHDPLVARFFCRYDLDVARRLRILLDSYELEDRAGFVDDVVTRIELNRDVMLRKAAGGDPAYGRLVEVGHVSGMNRAIDFLAERGADLQAQL
jgi:hypothetical protein